MTDDNDNQLQDEFLLSQYLDGQLGERQAADLERRLAKDGTLRRQMELYAALEKKLSALAQDAAPADVDYDWQRQEIMAALERRSLLNNLQPRRMFLRRPVPMSLMAAAAAVVIAFGGWFVTHRAGSAAETVASQVLPARMGSGAVEVAMEIRPIAKDEAAAAIGKRDEKLAKLPAGTVMVSVGTDENKPRKNGGGFVSQLESF